MTSDEQSSRARAAVFIKAALQALNDSGGSLPLREIKKEVAKRVQLTDRDKETYAKTGYVRWESILHFYSIDCVKAGLIRKHGGKWHLTPEGRVALEKPADVLLDDAVRAYRAWKAAQPPKVAPPAGLDESPNGQLPQIEEKDERVLVFERAEGEALAEIEEYIDGLSAYEFQDLVAALLRGMGYATPFVAEPGPDGGTDVLAYSDPIGAKTPHIRVQVKHKDEKATREEVAALRGIIRQDREIGLFVSSSGFTKEAVREARTGSTHIERMDLGRVLELWISNYEKLSEEDKALLPLRRVYFLAPE